MTDDPDVDSDDTVARVRDAATSAVRSVDAFAQRHSWIAFPYAVIKKFGDDRASYLAALVAYYGFFSIFPLLLVFVTVLGYVLADRPDLQESLIDSAFGQLPLIDPGNIEALQGNRFALVFGIVTALWAGLGAMQAMEHAMNTVWGVPRQKRPNFFFSRLRAISMLGVFGLGIIGVTALGASATVTGEFPLLARVGSPLLATLLAVGLFVLTYRVLTKRDLPWGTHLPGACVSGVLFVGLQLASGYYVDQVVKDAQTTYGVFAVVIGLLSWMFLQAQIAVLGAEVNAVRHDRLWPRRLPGGEPTEADRRYEGR